MFKRASGMPYLVALCWRCRSPSYFRDGSASWRCPYCGHVNKAGESLIVKRVLTVRDAVVVVQEMKARGLKPIFKRASSLT